MDRIQSIIKWVVATRIALTVLALSFDAFIDDYDQSTELLFDQSNSSIDSMTSNISNRFFRNTLYNISKTFARWDSFFMIEISQNGYDYEKNHAFFPLYPFILRQFFSIITNCFTFNQYTIVAILLLMVNLINLTINIFASIYLYKLGVLLLQNEKMAYLSVIVFNLNPSSVFYLAAYSESIFSLVTIVGLHQFYKRLFAFKGEQDQLFSSLTGYGKIMFPSILFFMVSVLARSVGIFFIVVIGYPVLQAFIKQFLQFLYQGKKINLNVILICLFWAGLIIILLITPYLFTLYQASKIYCAEDYYNKKVIGGLAPWCSDFIPNVYNFIQDKHWNVGFLKYYKPSRAFFIYWGMHSLLLLGFFLFKYIIRHWQSMMTLNLKLEDEYYHKTICETSLLKNNLNPICLYTIIVYLISLFYAHTQSCTRFFSTNPMFYWFICDALSLNKDTRKFTKLQHLIIIYIIYFNIMGTALFSNFLPWT